MANFPPSQVFNGRKFLVGAIISCLVICVVFGFGTYMIGQFFAPVKKPLPPLPPSSNHVIQPD